MTYPIDVLQAALTLQQQGKHEQAIPLLRGVLSTHSRSPDALHLLGVSLQAVGRSQEARKAIRKAIKLKPDVPMFHTNARVAAVAAGDIKAGIGHYRRALELDPDYADACNNLGVALQKLGKFEPAALAFARALEIKPELVSAMVNLGSVLSDLGRETEAITQYRQAVTLAPNAAEAHNNLGNVLKTQFKYAEAITCYDKALALRPDYSEAHFNRGTTMARRGDTEAALASLERAISLRPDLRYRLAYAGLLPVIPASRADIEKWRERFISLTSELYKEGLTDPGVLTGASVMNFDLAYHGEDDREIAVLLARLFRQLFPALIWETPHRFERPGQDGGRRIRLGVFSTFLRSHAVGWTIQGLLELIPKDQFDVTVFTVRSTLGPVMPEIRDAAEKMVVLPNSIERARQMLADCRLDALVFADIGMENLSSGLAHARLAPVQCALWGHPVTTGIPTIDYYISSDCAEPEDADEFYSERLVRLGGVQTCYRKPAVPSRGDLQPLPGIADDATVYLCPQSLFKIHPDMDDWFAEILRRDPSGVLVLFDGMDGLITEQMKARLSGAIGPAMNRVHFHPRGSFDRFMEVMVLSDVVLDTWPFGSGNTSYQGFAAGKPIVTLPGKYLRGRGVLAHYRHMEFMDCVAGSPEEYVDIAVRLGTDAEFNRHVTEMIGEHSHVLFDDAVVVEEFVNFLTQVAT